MCHALDSNFFFAGCVANNVSDHETHFSHSLLLSTRLDAPASCDPKVKARLCYNPKTPLDGFSPWFFSHPLDELSLLEFLLFCQLMFWSLSSLCFLQIDMYPLYWQSGSFNGWVESNVCIYKYTTPEFSCVFSDLCTNDTCFHNFFTIKVIGCDWTCNNIPHSAMMLAFCFSYQAKFLAFCTFMCSRSNVNDGWEISVKCG